MSADTTSPAQWQRALLAYGAPIPWRSACQLTGNLLAYFALWVAMWHAAEVSYLLALPLAVPAAGFLLRLFSIQHDCGHEAFFRSHSAMSAFSEKDLPPAMRADPNAPPSPITGPIPVRPSYTPGR